MKRRLPPHRPDPRLGIDDKIAMAMRAEQARANLSLVCEFCGKESALEAMCGQGAKAAEHNRRAFGVVKGSLWPITRDTHLWFTFQCGQRDCPLCPPKRTRRTGNGPRRGRHQ